MPAYVIRLDDIAPNMHWENYYRVQRLFLEFNVKPLIGVIPDNQDPQLLRFPAVSGQEFWQEIRRVQEAGWDIAQHGYQHVYVNRCAGLLGTSKASEFAQLPYGVQADKIRRGRDILMDRGIPTDTFMAPSHSFDATTLAALRDGGFRYVTDGYALYPYEEAGLTFVPQLVATPRAMPLGVHTFCLHVNGFREINHRRLRAFVQRHHRQVISFRQSLTKIGQSSLNRVAGNMLASSLRVARVIKAWGVWRRTKARDS